MLYFLNIKIKKLIINNFMFYFIPKKYPIKLIKNKNIYKEILSP